jgi:xanthine dehydrogenase iron-sulfur cluster and FAD-binding subunit A
MESFEKCLDGNLCRCTGYRPILDATKVVSCDGEQNETDAMLRAELAEFPTADELFPDELKEYVPEDLVLRGKKAVWYKPTSLESLLKLREAGTSSNLVAGSHSFNWQGSSQANIASIVSGFTDIGYSIHRGERGIKKY